MSNRRKGDVMRNHTARPKRESGFTLIELMVAVGVMAILAAIAFPNFQGVMRSNRLATTTNQVLGAMALARAEAIRNTRGSGVCASTDGSSCSTGTDWTTGWLVWSDVNGNGTYDGAGTDTALRYVQGNPKVTITGPSGATAVRFDARGRLTNTAQTIILQPDSCGSQALRRTLLINPTGQVRKSGSLAACL
ncbi:GspH/FimT family pseudopilin [Lysobacter sp. HA35]